jgi:hypothetical protein
MPLNELMARPIYELIDRISEEQDTDQLRELVLAINAVLNAIESQRARLEGDSPRTH